MVKAVVHAAQEGHQVDQRAVSMSLEKGGKDDGGENGHNFESIVQYMSLSNLDTHYLTLASSLEGLL